MRRVVIMLLALLIGATTSAAVPEKPRLRLIGVADGLPSSTVLALARDSAGYLWLATHDGLARYDGVGFRVWRHAPDDPQSLPGNYVAALHIDARDRVWVAIEGHGMSVLSADRRSFHHFRMDNTPGMASDDVWAIASHGDDVWFGTFGGGLHRMPDAGDLDDGPELRRYMPDPEDPRSLPGETVLALQFDSSGRLWAGTTHGVAYWDGRGFARQQVPGSAAGEFVFSLSPDGDAMWIGASNGLHRRQADGSWSALPWSGLFRAPNPVHAVARDLDGHHWIASASGLWRLAPGGEPVRVPIGTRGPAQQMFHLLQQEDGAVWFPVAGVGLGYLRPDWRGLAQFSQAEGGLADSVYPNVRNAAAGGVWLLGGKGELERLDRQGRLHPGPRPQPLAGGVPPQSIAEDQQGRLWMGQGRSLVRMQPDGQLRHWHPGQPDGPLGGQINMMQIAADGSLWMLCSGFGIQQRDTATGAVLTEIPAGPSHGLGVGDLEAMKFDHHGVLWIAGADGLARLDPATGHFLPVPGVEVGDRVFAFAFDGPDALWLQRLSGLERHQRQGDTWVRVERVGAAQGVPMVEGSGLAIDRRGRVWMSSLRGMFRWDRRTRHLRTFGLADGLSSQEFIKRGLELTPEGVLVGGLADGGVVLLDTNLPDRLPRKPALLWDGVEIRRDGAWTEPDTASGITLGPQDRELRVQLRLLAFDDAQANRYYTKLDGYDRDWIAQGASGERVLAGLPPGSYTLRGSAIDAAGNAATEQQLHFTVQPPWWRTTGAMAGMVLIVMLLLAGLGIEYRDRLRRRHAAQRAEHEREVSRDASLAKTRFLATLGHEVRTPMTGVLGMSELLLGTALDPQQRGYTESIRGAGEHLLRLVNDALDLARIESGKLELTAQPFDLHALVAEVVALMAPLAQRRGLAFECDLTDTAPRGVTGDSVRVRQILLNLIGNAIKFTERGEVRLRVSGLATSQDGVTRAGDALNTGVVFQVSDTGPGLNQEQCSRLFRRFEQAEGSRTAARYGGSGLGLAICQELALAMDGRIDVDSAPGEGTRFSVALPLASAVLPEVARGPVASAVSGASLKLLLVEDDPTVAEVLVGLLQAQGHRVTHAAHGLAAMTEVATTGFDGALLDLDLPGIDGFALARQLRSQGFTRPLIAITARADADAQPHAVAAGFDGFLRKPVTGGMLAQLLRGHAQRERETV